MLDNQSVQVIMAAAKAAGLHKGGLRRTAFSMGDLSALQPPGPPSPPEGWSAPLLGRMLGVLHGQRHSATEITV